MEGGLRELAGYRLARAREMLSASESNLILPNIQE